MNGYRFNLAVFAVGCVIIFALVLLAFWLGLHADTQSGSALAVAAVVGAAVMEGLNAAIEVVLGWRNKAQESEGK